MSPWDAAAVAGYFGLILAFLGWELAGLRRSNDGWPPFTQVLRAIMRDRWPVKVALLGGWILLGWHFDWFLLSR